MQVQVMGHHVEITEGLRQFVQLKAAKLEESFPKLRKVAVVLTVEKYRHTAELHCHAEGLELSARKTTKDMYASIEEALSALEQQAAKRKDRLHTGSGLRREAAKLERRRQRETPLEAARPAPAKPKVLRVKLSAAKVLSLDQAVEVLEASADPCLLFREGRGEAVQILFRRADGRLALAQA